MEVLHTILTIVQVILAVGLVVIVTVKNRTSMKGQVGKSPVNQTLTMLGEVFVNVISLVVKHEREGIIF